MRTCDEQDVVVEVQTFGPVVVVAVAGELDLVNADALDALLDAASRDARRVVVDLERVSFSDMRGLRALERVADRLARRGASLVVANASRSFLRLAGVSRSRVRVIY
jgi:anti-anti-sigma factor